MSDLHPGERELTLGNNKEAYRSSGMKLDLIADHQKRPIEYSEEVAEYIINQVASGKSLLSICRDERLPHPTTIVRWRDSYTDFDESYKKALVHRARIKHEEAEQEIEKLEHCEDKTQAYIADVRNRNRFRLMEIGSPHDYSTKLMMTHKHEGPILNLSLDLSTPQTIGQPETKIIESNQSSLKSLTDCTTDQNTKTQEIESSEVKEK